MKMLNSYIYNYQVDDMSLKLNISINEIHEVKICLNFIRPPCNLHTDIMF